MACKKIFTIFLALMISLSLSACSGFSDSDMDIYEKIHNHYSKMESYTANLDMTVYSNKTKNQYFITQKAKSGDKYYTKVTDKDATFSVTTITNGTLTKTIADGSEHSLTVPSSEYLGVLFLDNFFRAYYASEETALLVDKSLKGSNTVLEVSLFADDIAIKRVSLSIDNKTLTPATISVFGAEDNLLAKGTFEDFCYNDKIDDSLFNID